LDGEKKRNGRRRSLYVALHHGRVQGIHYQRLIIQERLVTASRESLFCVCYDVTKQKGKIVWKYKKSHLKRKCSRSAASVMIIGWRNKTIVLDQTGDVQSEHHGQQVPYKTRAALGKSQIHNFVCVRARWPLPHFFFLDALHVGSLDLMANFDIILTLAQRRKDGGGRGV
jgi:hypothetical protein